MAASVEATIMTLLFERVASNPTGLPIAWPNKAFAPPGEGKFLRVIFVPNSTDRVFIGSDDQHRYMGLLQVSVQWPKNMGEAEVREAAAQVASHFPCDLRLGNDALSVRITKRPHVADLIIEDARIQIPVMISWDCWA